MASIFGRAIIVTKTNKSGGSLAKGDVVIVDSSNDNAVTTTTTSATTVTVGVVVEENGIANNASGRVQFGGHVGLVTPNASVTRGHYGATHTVAKQCTDAGASRVVGTFCVFTTGGTTPEADLFTQPDASSATGNMATDALWDAAGDLAVGTGANTGAKLAIGASAAALVSNGTTAVWGYPTHTISENFITGNVAVTSANTFYDGPSLSLAAGTYLLVAKIRQGTGSANTWCVAKLWDGTNIFDASEFYVETSGGGNVHALAGTVVFGTTTTVKVSCADNSGGGTILATPATNNTGLTNKASHLVALRIA